jgi:Ran GTPase-activating protein (RanGAP) involved in mRNA processing and transport
LANNRLGDVAGKEIALMLGDSKASIIELDIGGNKLGNGSAVLIGKDLEGTVPVFRQKLTRDECGLTPLLRLKRCHVCGQCQSSRVTTPLTGWHCKSRPNTEGAKKLKKLNLRRNEVGDLGGVALGKMLVLNTSLKVLDVSDNRLGEESASAFVEALTVRCASPCSNQPLP